ncbi:3-deoxy-D-manno-octulosonic acid transferase [Tenacibaculum sp. KUL118]|nr:3-deoxy-D-manno-octulosonic acid transferase [Tenacibaculum sp. KUL118]
MPVARRSDYKPNFVETLCRWGYSCVLVLLVPFAFAHLALKGATKSKDGKHRHFERLGFVTRPPKENGYLFHCVSVGEVVAASCLIKRIMSVEPEAQITITTTTPTGSARVRDIFKDTVHHFYLPYDLPITMAAMLKRVKPKMVIVTEVELWPNLIHACWKRYVPVIVINARMTDRSAKRYKKIGQLFNPMLAKLSHVCAQGQRDHDNYAWLGLDKDKLTLTNNIKFDQAVSHTDTASSFLDIKRGERPLLVAGSTHEPEEKAVLEAALSVWKVSPLFRMIIVPRHPERFETVAKIIEKYNLPFVRTSDVTSIPEDVNIVLLDEMGKLNQAYAVASFAFVGGSIAQRGGHNALEPATFSLPIMMGPHTFNNPVICEYLEDCGALTIVENATQISALLNNWIENPTKGEQAGRAGKRVLQNNSGALDATLACVRRYLN